MGGPQFVEGAAQRLVQLEVAALLLAAPEAQVGLAVEDDVLEQVGGERGSALI